MPYATTPDHRIPYHLDGTVTYTSTGTQNSINFANCPANVLLNATDLYEMNDEDGVKPTSTNSTWANTGSDGSITVYWFFPELRVITGGFFAGNGISLRSTQGSADSTDGQNGTWWTITGDPYKKWTGSNHWRTGITTSSFPGAVRIVRTQSALNSSGAANNIMYAFHLYGHTDSGAMSHDLVFVDYAGAPVDFANLLDFQDVPIGSPVTREFRVRNTSGSRTATNVVLTKTNMMSAANTDFAIATTGTGSWVTSINVGSIGPGAESPSYWVKAEPVFGGVGLNPIANHIRATCDSGFFG